MVILPMTEEESTLALFVRRQEISEKLIKCSETKLTHEAISHKILYPLASHVITAAGIDGSWRRWAMIMILSSERDAARCAQAMQKTIKILEENNISSIVIKGPSLAFGKPRDSGDVDILIDESSLLEAITCLEAEGYRYRGFERNIHIRHHEYRDWNALLKWTNQFEFTEPDTGVLIELHTSFFETGRTYEEDLSDLRARIGEFFSSAGVDEATGYRFLSIEDRVLLLALHCGLKRSPARKSFILRQFIDLNNLIESGFDWDLLEQKAFHFKIAHHVLLLLCLYDSLVCDASLAQYIRRYESRLSVAMVRLQRLHMRCLVGVGSYDRMAILAYRIVAPFVCHGTISARLRSLLIFPLFFLEPYALAEIYGIQNRSPVVFLCYFIEPLRMLHCIIIKAIKKTTPQNWTRLPSFFARDSARRSMPIPSGKANAEKVIR